MPVSPALAKAYSRYRARDSFTRKATLDRISRQWDNQRDYRDTAMDEFAAANAATLDAGKKATASNTAAFTRFVSREVTGKAMAASVPVMLGRGVSSPELLIRPAHATWSKLAQGQSLRDAVAYGGFRLMQIITTELQLAKTQTAHSLISDDDRVLWYERVPEADACEICLIASEGQYATEDLMPIHQTCMCDVVPIYSGTNADMGMELTDNTEPMPEGVEVEVFNEPEIGPALRAK